MNDKRPVFVIIAAILNFITCATLAVILLITGFALLFGNLFGLIGFLTTRLTETYPGMNVSMGFNVIFSIIFAVCFAFFIFYLWLGIGLLRGQKLAWYFQIGLSIVGIFGFPMGTIMNGTILVFFFLPSVRNYFKI